MIRCKNEKCGELVEQLGRHGICRECEDKAIKKFLDSANDELPADLLADDITNKDTAPPNKLQYEVFDI